MLKKIIVNTKFEEEPNNLFGIEHRGQCVVFDFGCVNSVEDFMDIKDWESAKKVASINNIVTPETMDMKGKTLEECVRAYKVDLNRGYAPNNWVIICNIEKEWEVEE